MNETVNNRIKTIRKRMNLSQESFSKEIGVSRAHISNIENGNDNPSSALIKLISIKYNIDEDWLINGNGSPDSGWDIRTDEGILAKYEALRLMFENTLKSSSGNDLVNMVESFSYLVSLMSTKKLSPQDASDYLNSVRIVIDYFEKMTFRVSCDKITLPSKKDVHGWLQLEKDCQKQIDIMEDNIKNAANIYLKRYGEEMKL